MLLLENTLQSPAQRPVDPGFAKCPSVAQTFVSKGTCVKQDTCNPLKFNDKMFTLNQTNLRHFYTLGGRHVHYFDGLRLEAPYDITPCTGVSRWKITNGACASPTALDSATVVTIHNALSG